MAKQITHVKEFLTFTQRQDAAHVFVKKTGKVTKFKLRCSKHLYTIVIRDAAMADRLKSTIPASLLKN
ncbi:hypothetical protein H696_02470 [Fonticula alba]|uniref:60S ribosomal protein L38 n=1 Tax=Fonticula alba TaxID=691883 RepID=A0A058ZAT9_FONAL|nr:hypothetical protein H696_02470 [Fonticula alba]KCV71535.1 hypothetical protein H696_02470 [Fonticula alba]|eukprot:XP_009494658.1 hypothetical protein H696_02470 [Fonticula alba]